MWYFASGDLEQQISQLSVRVVLIASVILIVATILALLLAKRKKIFNKVKLPLFAIMATALVGATLLLFGSTIYLNTKAESKGPVHWHADIEFWACGNEVELRDPTGFLSNKIGSATYHEHNDKRIHLEGVVVKKSEDASLKKFMSVTGGYITENEIAIPVNDRYDEWFVKDEALDGDQQGSLTAEHFTGPNHPDVIEDPNSQVLLLRNGQNCPGGGEPAELQTFVYTYDEKTKTYSQTKLFDPSKYIMRDEPNVPPGDCVIVEYGPPRDRTDKLCEQYGVRDSKRCVEFGAKEFNPKVCNISEIVGGTP